MKKTIFLFIIIIFIIILWGCTQGKDSNSYIEKAKLTKEEEQMARLLVDLEEYRIYDFEIDKDIKTLEINISQLKDGKWEFVSGGLDQFKDRNGRISLNFKNLGEGIRLAIESESSSGSSSYSTESIKEINKENIIVNISSLEERKEIVYEEEIPIVIQSLSYKDSLDSFDVNSFFTPEVYKERDYEGVYAITLMFSEKTMEELTEDKDI